MLCTCPDGTSIALRDSRRIDAGRPRHTPSAVTWVEESIGGLGHDVGLCFSSKRSQEVARRESKAIVVAANG